MAEPRILPTIKWQQKILSANQTSNGTMSDLTFNNLEIGKTYRASVQVAIITDGSDSAQVDITHNGSVIGTVQSRESNSGVIDQETSDTSAIFTATATALTFVAVSIGNPGTRIVGTNSRTSTYATLEELPNHEETSQW